MAMATRRNREHLARGGAAYVFWDARHSAPERARSEDGRGGFRTCDLSRVKRALSH
jgi:hypothetical protein